MKTLKVKFILFSLTALFAISLTSCEQEIIETPLDEIDRVEQLQSDPNYTTLVTLNNQLSNEISSAMAIKNVTGEDLKNMYVNGEADLLQAFFEGTQVVSIMEEVVTTANQLSSEYSDLIPASQGFDSSVLEGFSSLGSTSVESRCWQYYVCVAGASAGLVACTAGTSGIGLAPCYAAYAAAIALCIDAYLCV